MKILFDTSTIKASKRNDLNNPITRAFFNLAEGAKEAGFETVISTDYNIDADVVFVFGSITDRKKNTPRARSIQTHRDKNTHIFSLDSGLFSTYIRNTFQSGETYMFRIGYKDCTGLGEFFNSEASADRFEYFKKNFNINPKDPYMKKDLPILFIMQSEKGWTYNENIPYIQWAKETVSNIQKVSKRPIILRTHPMTPNEDFDIFENVFVEKCETDRRSLLASIEKCSAVITHSSSSVCESYVEGKPSFALDKRCIVYDACENNLEKLENPELIDWSFREQILRNWANTTWHLNEMKNPDLIRYYINNISYNNIRK